MARFEVSTAGMRKLQAGRPAAHLAKELISNALDERSVNKIVVSIRKIDTRNALFEVEDDGEGFADITHAWTLYAPTVKQRDATVRGRFNLGEKEILSVARRGFIHTTSGRVEFDGDARKFSAKNKRERGTVVSLEMPWTKEQCAEVEEFFKEIDPVGKVLTVNGVVHPESVPVFELETVLPSPIEDDEGNITLQHRKACVRLYKPRGKAPVIAEMGIPVQETDCPWTIDVSIKVPLSPQRDAIKDTYLQDLYAEVLNTVADDLTEDQVSDTWVKVATKDSRAKPETVKVVADKRYGKKAAIINPFDPAANERARQAGYYLVRGQTLDAVEREHFQAYAGIQSTSAMFGTTPATPDAVETTKEMQRFASFVEQLSGLLTAHRSEVGFYSLKGAIEAAQNFWDGAAIRFNVANLPKDFFDKIDADRLSIVAHEMAHTQGRGADGEPHGVGFMKQFQRIAGEMTMLALSNPELFDLEAYS